VASLGSTIRLHLLEALHEAADELTASAEGVRVEVRLVGREPVLALVQEPGEEPAAEGLSGTGFPYGSDELARLTLRLPEGLKSRVEQVAAAANASVNSWVVVALGQALDSFTRFGPQPQRRMPRRMRGFAQG